MECKQNYTEVVVTMKIRAKTHQKLKIQAAKAGKPVYEIVTSAILKANQANKDYLNITEEIKNVVFRGNEEDYSRVREIARNKGLTVREYTEKAIEKYLANNEKEAQ